jgi:hypothetical protein
MLHHNNFQGFENKAKSTSRFKKIQEQTETIRENS